MSSAGRLGPRDVGGRFVLSSTVHPLVELDGAPDAAADLDAPAPAEPALAITGALVRELATLLEANPGDPGLEARGRDLVALVEGCGAVEHLDDAARAAWAECRAALACPGCGARWVDTVREDRPRTVFVRVTTEQDDHG